ncbi:type III-B CRISPR-associated protein Cas10/Cmr2 [Tautonia marina]|uniref:type III-B CRISPR-associated protein Cas10/Cmr2 n=1 Tax=Tautonia marina TaxID=2653855 RepID=UPI0013758782|nr:type III-B CRISPR-associated protein Cas10/Cmr2 [Tautonia marina]
MDPLDAADAETRGHFLAFSLGPVQPFIASARSVRDLWTGSYLLSWLCLAAMQPIRHRFGDGAILSPSLDGNPLLETRGDAREGLPSACLPNRFLARIPDDDDDTTRLLADECERSCRAGWKRISGAVRQGLAVRMEGLDPHWDRLWDDQVDDFFEVHTVVLPLARCDAPTLERLLGEQNDPTRPDGLAWGRLQLIARLMEARRSAGHHPAYAARGDVPQKCSLLGSYEQMGPAGLDESRRFWEALAVPENAWSGTRTRQSERLCAVSLVKRFAWPAFLHEEVGLPPESGYFPDTATVAASRWLATEPEIRPDRERGEHGAWSGQWLHRAEHEGPGRRRVDDDRDPPPRDGLLRTIRRKRLAQDAPPAYLAILMMDGDRLGQWLAGIGPDGTTATRVAPNEWIAAISRALAQFSVGRVPEIVRRHGGIPIYSGGDDVLAFLPLEDALPCVRELRDAYVEGWARWVEPLCEPEARSGATVSAGLAVVHHKEDLRYALGRARAAEHAAKEAGRDAVTLAICRRSGEHTSVDLPREMVPRLERWHASFAAGASDRWLYTLRSEFPTLGGDGLPWPAVKAEVRRVAARAEDSARRIDPGEAVGLLDAYREAMEGRGRSRERVLEDFITLAQSASFLARGRD